MVSRGLLLHRIPQMVAAGRDRLLTTGWLSRTSPAFQEALLANAIWKTASAGEEYVHAGDVEGGLVGLALGTAEVAMEAAHPDTRFVHLAYPGHWAGYRPLLGKARNISITARTDVLYTLIPQRTIAALLRETPRFWQHIAQQADGAFEDAVQIMVDLTRKDGLVRVACTLLRLGGCRHADPIQGAPAEIHVQQGDIAALTVMSRSTMSLYLHELAARRLVELCYGYIRLTDPGGLRALVEADE
jgi:CRP-like cAMP-binding protein